MSIPLVSCHGLVCRLAGQTVLNGIDLEIAAGESMALLGTSGSGKSTLLRSLVGLEIPERGEVLIAGQSATDGGVCACPPLVVEWPCCFKTLPFGPISRLQATSVWVYRGFI